MDIVVKEALFGNVIDAKLVHPSNALIPKVVSESGRVIEVKDIQFLKQFVDKDVTVLANETDINVLADV